jgi:hypothetical protein
VKNHKAAAPSPFTPELLKYLAKDEQHQFATCLCEMFNTFAMKGIPAIWNKLIVTSLFKAGDQEDPSNYRGLSVM